MTRTLIAVSIGLALITLALTAFTAAPVAAQSSLLICFVNEGQTACVDRPAPVAPQTITGEIRLLTQLLIAGPTGSEQAHGAQSSLPSDTRLDAVTVNDRKVAVQLTLSDDALKALTDQQVEDINEQFRTTFTPYNFQNISIDARRSAGVYQPLSKFLKPIEIPKKPHPPTSLSPSPALAGEGWGGGGGLMGKTVFVAAGHGWYWNTTLNNFQTQRPAYPTAPPYSPGEGIVEDFNNAEAVNQYLLQYLWNAGADAWPVRERDMHTNMIIVDDGSADFSTQGAWTVNGGGYNGTYRSATTIATSATATATWTFVPSASSIYAVYVHFPTIGTTPVVDAHLYVQHAGATTPIVVQQTRDADTWRFIGWYPFYGGQPAQIFVTNQSSTPGVTVLADAVRIGGGVGDTSVSGAPISNKPRWEEEALPYAKWMGLPNADENSDVVVRPIYSEWEKDPGEDAVYVAWHTNGYNGYNTTIRGTETYIHDTEPTPNSDLLQSYLHTELINDIHAGWDATWPDRGKKTQDLGELRLLQTMPGVLIENGFHDNPIDVEALKDPRFLQLSARAIYHGLVRYWHAIDPNVPLTFFPEPPQRVMVRNSGPGQITIEWRPGPIGGNGLLGDEATAYRVYTSTDGFGWSNPIEVVATAYTLTQLAPDQLIYVKVTGVNAGGESFASPVLSARVASVEPARVLLVYGFDRIDRYGDIQQDDPPEGISRRVFVDRINRFDAIIKHAVVMTLPFDSAQQAAVSQGSIGLGNYTLVDWIAGEDQTPFTALTTNDQTALTNFLNNGGALFISGSEIGYELQNTSFYANTLRASYVADDAQTYTANSTANGLFSGLGAINFDDGSHGMYNVDYADVFAPINGASSALVYNTASAALQYANGCTRLVYSGVPFETIYPRATRQAMLTRLIGFFDPQSISITGPANGADLNRVPNIDGLAGGRGLTGVQISLKRDADALFYNGAAFSSSAEVWLPATGTGTWSYALPALNDGKFTVRARAVTSCVGNVLESTPVTFTLDTMPPAVPTLVAPQNGITLTAIAPLFQWSGGGDPTGFYLYLDGLTTTLSSPVLSATRMVTDGQHDWRVQAFDAAGNLSNWSATGTFTTTSLKTFFPWVSKNDGIAMP